MYSLPWGNAPKDYKLGIRKKEKKKKKYLAGNGVNIELEKPQ